jgi:hypothetical protein
MPLKLYTDTAQPLAQLRCICACEQPDRGTLTGKQVHILWISHHQLHHTIIIYKRRLLSKAVTKWRLHWNSPKWLARQGDLGFHPTMLHALPIGNING